MPGKLTKHICCPIQSFWHDKTSHVPFNSHRDRGIYTLINTEITQKRFRTRDLRDNHKGALAHTNITHIRNHNWNDSGVWRFPSSPPHESISLWLEHTHTPCNLYCNNQLRSLPNRAVTLTVHNRSLQTRDRGKCWQTDKKTPVTMAQGLDVFLCCLLISSKFITL